MTITEPGHERLSKCTIALQHLFWKNYLLLNPDKSDEGLYGTRPGSKRPGLPSLISVAGCAINVSERLKILGITLDATLAFDDHITSVVRACNFHMHALRHIRCSVSQDITNTIVCSILGSRLDYCNTLLFDASVKTVSRLQRVSEQFGTNSLRHRHQQTFMTLAVELATYYVKYTGYRCSPELYTK